MLPQGRYDTRLIEYGFTPYGTHQEDELRVESGELKKN